MNRTIWRSIALPIAAITAAATLAACGSKSGTASAGSAASGSPASIKAAQSLLAQYSNGNVAQFPVTAKLSPRPASGTTYAVLQCSTPFCAQLASLFEQAAKALGVKTVVVSAGSSATDEQNAMSAIIAKHPQGVIIPGIEPDSILPQIKQLKSEGVPVVSLGVLDAQNYGIDWDNSESPNTQILAGKLQAAWAYLQKGDATNVVFYKVPDLTFTTTEETGFRQEMTSLCSSCRVRTVNIAVSTIGSTAPSAVVADLQGHQSTNVAVFSVGEAATGVPSALKVAGIDIPISGYVPTSAIFSYIKSGEVTAGLATDLPLQVYETVDVLARLQENLPLSAQEKNGGPYMQMVEQKDITFDPSVGWLAFKDYQSRFAQVWGS